MHSEVISSVEQLISLLDEADGVMTTLANASAYLNELLTEINWVGFYLLRGDELVLGPFQGKTACVRIAMGRGVCGTAAARRETVLVEDVHAFPGHIACDSASNSEIVIPLFEAAGDARSGLIGVLDLDSPKHARFDAEDQRGLERLARIFERSLRA